MSNLPFLKGLGSPAPPQGGAPPQPGGGVTPPGGQQQPAPPPQDPSYIQGQVNEYMRQQGIQKQQQQLNQQKKGLRQQMRQPPVMQPGQQGLPQAGMTNPTGPLTGIMGQLLGKLGVSA